MSRNFEVHEVTVYKIWDNQQMRYYTDLETHYTFDQKSDALKFCRKLNDLIDAAKETVRNNYSWLRRK